MRASFLPEIYLSIYQKSICSLFISLTPPARLQLAITMAKLCMLLLMASPLISALVVTRAAPTAVVAPTLARSCDVAAAARTQRAAAIVMMGRRGGGDDAIRGRKEKVAKDVLELDGTVLESLPNAMFRVQLVDSEQAGVPCTSQRLALPGLRADALRPDRSAN